jgi:hypothetical protein
MKEREEQGGETEFYFSVHIPSLPYHNFHCGWQHNIGPQFKLTVNITVATKHKLFNNDRNYSPKTLATQLNGTIHKHVQTIKKVYFLVCRLLITFELQDKSRVANSMSSSNNSVFKKLRLTFSY